MSKHYNNIWMALIAISMLLLVSLISGRIQLSPIGTFLGFYFAGLMQGLAWVFYTLNIFAQRNHKKNKK
jgi:threonine/homoserine efflux transporter RhtA